LTPRSIHFTLWFLTAGASELLAQAPAPAPAGATISIQKLWAVKKKDSPNVDLLVRFDSTLDPEHSDDNQKASNITILAKPSGKTIKPDSIQAIQNTALISIRALPDAKDDHVNVCFSVLHFLGDGLKAQTSPANKPVCSTDSKILSQNEAKAAADQLVKDATDKAKADKTSSEKDIFASGFVTTAGQSGTQGGGDISLNDFVPGLTGANTFLQVQKTSVANGDPRHFEVGLSWRHTTSFDRALDNKIAAEVKEYEDPKNSLDKKTLGEKIGKDSDGYGAWLGALEDFALKIEGDPTQFKAANAVGDGDIRILTRTLPLFGSTKGYFRARPLVVGLEGGKSIGQGAATTTTTGTTTTTTTPDVNWIARAKVGADLTLFYDNSDDTKAKSSANDAKAKGSLIKRVEISAGGVERYLFFKEINYNPATKSDSSTGKGSRPYFQSDVKVFFAEDDKARYGLRMAYTRGSLPPVFADVKSFQFGFVVETKDDKAKTKDDKTKTANNQPSS
jgi:hypothetical protein